MYSLKNKGYGVYHKPIYDLAEHYLSGKITDLTGTNFFVLKRYLSAGHPIWIITNTTFKKLPQSYFETWNTQTGKIVVTHKEHSVLITGYDNKYIYFNDPRTGEKNKRAGKSDFIQAWIQMGSQAISYNG